MFYQSTIVFSSDVLIKYLKGNTTRLIARATVSIIISMDYLPDLEMYLFTPIIPTKALSAVIDMKSMAS